MTMYIITPCFDEKKDVILKNIRSIQNQKNISIRFIQLIIFDGVKRNDLNFLKNKYKNLYLLNLRHNHNDYGDYVRKIGTKISLMNKASSVTYLDADNYVDTNHLQEIFDCHVFSNKNVIISNRRLIKENDNVVEEKKIKFFDTNTISFFNEYIDIGLLWGKYPRELSLIGDRIISYYIKSNFSNEIAFTNEYTINYQFSRISKEKQINLKSWYDNKYLAYKSKFLETFGFDLKI